VPISLSMWARSEVERNKVVDGVDERLGLSAMVVYDVRDEGGRQVT
jgi:hypothetical protein